MQADPYKAHLRIALQKGLPDEINWPFSLQQKKNEYVVFVFWGEATQRLAIPFYHTRYEAHSGVVADRHF